MTAPAPARPSAPEAPAMAAAPAPAPATPAAASRAGRTVRYYPTDLLLAMEEADRPGSGLDELLDAHRLAALRPLFGAGEEFADGLDELLGGLAQYPWQPLTDTNDVDVRSLGRPGFAYRCRFGYGRGFPCRGRFPRRLGRTGGAHPAPGGRLGPGGLRIGCGAHTVASSFSSCWARATSSWSRVQISWR